MGIRLVAAACAAAFGIFAMTPASAAAGGLCTEGHPRPPGCEHCLLLPNTGTGPCLPF